MTCFPDKLEEKAIIPVRVAELFQKAAYEIYIGVSNIMYGFSAN